MSTTPSPVNVENIEPIPVVVKESPEATASNVRRDAADANAAALTGAGQRRVNIIWEITQSLIALAVTISTLYVSSSLATSGRDEMAAFLLLSNAFFLVIGFYFGRTNHQRIGGVGPNEAGR